MICSALSGAYDDTLELKCTIIAGHANTWLTIPTRLSEDRKIQCLTLVTPPAIACENTMLLPTVWDYKLRAVKRARRPEHPAASCCILQHLAGHWVMQRVSPEPPL